MMDITDRHLDAEWLAAFSPVDGKTWSELLRLILPHITCLPRGGVIWQSTVTLPKPEYDPAVRTRVREELQKIGLIQLTHRTSRVHMDVASRFADVLNVTLPVLNEEVQERAERIVRQSASRSGVRQPATRERRRVARRQRTGNLGPEERIFELERQLRRHQLQQENQNASVGELANVVRDLVSNQRESQRQTQDLVAMAVENQRMMGQVMGQMLTAMRPNVLPNPTLAFPAQVMPAADGLSDEEVVASLDDIFRD